MTPGPVAVSLNGRFDTGSTAVAADAPLASDNDTPTNPNAETLSFRFLRIDACFVFSILEILPSPCCYHRTVGRAQKPCKHASEKSPTEVGLQGECERREPEGGTIPPSGELTGA